MKTNYNKMFLRFFVLLLLSSISTSCTLEREDYDKIYPDMFYKTENDLKVATTSAYNLFSLQGVVYRTERDGINVLSEMATDVMDCQWGDGGSWESFHLHSWPTDGTVGSFARFKEFKQISKMRKIILAIEESPVVDADDLKKAYIAEVRTLRAWLMFCLYDLFGPVPIASDEMLDDIEADVYPSRLTNADYVKLVVDELKLALKDLPVKSAESGRMNAGIANMMLLKVYMHEKNWSEAELAARELMKPQYEYRLLDDYSDCFSIATEINDENIWSIECTQDAYANMWVTHVLSGDYPYPNTKVQAWGGYRIPWKFYHTFESKDKRLKNVVAEYTNKEGALLNEKTPGESLVKGAMPLKYNVDPDQTGPDSGTDFPVFRYSDVLLSLAECIARQGNVTQEAMDRVNDIRRRAGLDDYELADYTDKTKFFDMLLLERGHELFCEGHRRSDLIRYGKFIEFAREIPNSQTADYKVLYPIPNWFLVATKGAWKNNEGY